MKLQLKFKLKLAKLKLQPVYYMPGGGGTLRPASSSFAGFAKEGESGAASMRMPAPRRPGRPGLHHLLMLLRRLAARASQSLRHVNCLLRHLLPLRRLLRLQLPLHELRLLLRILRHGLPAEAL